MMREHFGQHLHNTLFSFSVEVNDLRGLQAVYNYLKMRDEIRNMDSLVFDQVAFHESHARIDTDGKTRAQRRQFGIQIVKHHIGSHEPGLLCHDWIGLPDRQHLFALNHKDVEIFPARGWFDQTPYKLPAPTPVHVPAEKRPLEEKFLPFSKRRVHITPVIRRVYRRPELPMASGQIPVSPVKIPQSSVQIPEPPVQISLSQILSSGSFPVSPSLESVSASKYGGLPFGSHALYVTGGCVSDLVDVVGRLGDASRRESTLAYGVPRPSKRDLETHVERSLQKALAHGMPSDITNLEHI
ncbi:hypothetical protein TNCV_4875671 [Trichonephila clavipes]|nr:hypothetical protein TNCV_4875671 [Trichonephila clavipes]